MRYIAVLLALIYSSCSSFGGGEIYRYSEIGRGADISAIRKAAHDVSELWPNSVGGYRNGTEGLMRGMNDVIKTHPELRDEAYSIAADVLQRDAFSLGRKVIPIMIAQDVSVTMLLSIENQIDSPGWKKLQTATLVASSIAKSRAKFIPGYTEKLVRPSVSPPEGAVDKEGFSAPGMSPESITDPKLREQYREAIEENKQLSITNDTQHMLAMSLPYHVALLQGFCKRLVVSNPELLGQVNEILKSAGIEVLKKTENAAKSAPLGN